jgi:hypothetical protein
LLYLMGRNKRSLERDLNRESPPNKMSTRGSETSELIAHMEQLKERFAKIEKEVADISKFVREVETMRAKVGELQVVCEGYQRSELETKKRCVLLKGLRFGSESKFETRQQTKAVLADFFGRVEMAPHLVDYQRLGGKRDGENGNKVSIRVQFADVDQKFVLYDKLKEKGRDLQDVSVLTDYPFFQLDRFKQLSEAAYNIRKENPGTRTRIVPKGLGLNLQRRPRDSDGPWMSVSV